MKIHELIDQCRKTKTVSLDEAASKRILSEYGIPVVEEVITADENTAVAVAGKMGYPVVLKGFGSSLAHKTEMGLVRVNLADEHQVRTAFSQIKIAGGEAWEGCLVQPMVTGQREVVAGLIRDPQFGPVVMFGLGGIFAEALKDVVFRIAPLTEEQARDMMSDLSARNLLGAFRGQAPADTAQLARVLTGLSRLGTDFPDIKEVDINPLIISADGRITAVDALVVLTDDLPDVDVPDPETAQQKSDKTVQDLKVMTRPQSIAVVGVARTPAGPFPGIYRCMRDFGYAGRLYPINPGAPDIDGAKSYPSLKALPEKVDLVILSISADRVPAALDECVEAGCRNVHIFTSGFAESGEPEGIRLQEEIRQIALNGGLNIIGPNCMGIHVPALRVLTWKNASKISGPVGMVSQSGGHAQDFAHLANRMGLYFSKIISFGNAVTMDSTDFLPFFAQDADTRIISMYLEGVKDGRTLLEQVTRINRKKPVVILKGGLTESGARTVASHTGSLAGGASIWKGFFRQTGAVQVNSLDEMAQTIMAFEHLPPVRGKRVAILGTGGGIGVAAADSCARTGLEMPQLSPETMDQLRQYIPPAGNMIRNPIDAHIVIMKLDLLGPTLELLAKESYLDMFILSLHLDWIYGKEEGAHIDSIGRYLAEEARKHLNGKPLVVVWRQYQPQSGIKAARERLERQLQNAGIPVYEGLDASLGALSKVAEYYTFHSRAVSGPNWEKN